MISLNNISKSFDGGKTFAVKDISLDIKTGKTLVLLGGSGSGKSTILKMINCLIEPTTGTIEVDGENIQDLDPTELRRSIGYVLQKAGLFPHMNIQENVAIKLRLQGKPVSERIEKARELLSLVDLDPNSYAKRFPLELSGGELQRVGVARAIACKPNYLLMDEPFGALDAITRDSLQKELIALREKIQKTIIFVTHDIFEATRLGDEIAVINEGVLEQVGDKKTLINQPKTPYVKDLFQKFKDQLNQFEAYFE